MIGINQNSTILDSTTQLILQSRFSNFGIAIEAEVINKIPYTVSHSQILNITNNFLKLKFAESNALPYCEVDIVLGAEYVEFVLGDQRHFYEGIYLRNTKFGYIISGSQKSTFFTKTLYCCLSKIDIDAQLKRFCELEDVCSNSSSKTAETLFEYQNDRRLF